MERITFLDRATMGPDIQLPRPRFDHEWIEYEHTAEPEVARRLKGATIAITNKVSLRETTLEQLPDLKMIAVAATGYDVVDIAVCARRGIAVSNVRGYATRSVPEHVFALIFALQRSLLAYRNDVISGQWERSGQFCFYADPIRDVAGATLGIIGSGSLGRAVAGIGEALGMTCLFAGRKGHQDVGHPYVPFEEVLRRSDILTLHCPLTEDTRNLIARPEFEHMRRCPVLINCSRGGLVNERDLNQALERGLIAGAGIDCVDGEPPSPHSPIHEIKRRRNVIVTPHIAWASQSARLALWNQVIDCMEAHVDGAPINDVTAA